MKKILSFLLVVAVIFSFSALSVNAEEKVIYIDSKIEGNVCTVSFTPNFDDAAIMGVEVYFTPTNFVPAGVVSSVSGGSMLIADYAIFEADANLYCISGFSMSGSFQGETHTITFDITPSGDAAIDFDMETSYCTDGTDMFYLAVAQGNPYETLTPAEINTTGNVLANVKYGTALFSTFAAPAAKVEFKWAVDIDDVRYYSTEVYTQDGLEVGDDVIVSASYDNADNAAVKNVDLIVKADEKFYLTNETDWDNK